MHTDVMDETETPDVFPPEQMPDGRPYEQRKAELEQAERERKETLAMVPADQIVVDGPAQLAMFSWHGKAPQTVMLKIKMPVVAVDGAFCKGERVRFAGEAVIVSEGARDVLDRATRTVSESVQSHEAVVLDLRVL